MASSMVSVLNSLSPAPLRDVPRRTRRVYWSHASVGGGRTWPPTTVRQWRGCGLAEMVDSEVELDGFVARFPLDGALARCCAVRSACLLVACERVRRQCRVRVRPPQGSAVGEWTVAPRLARRHGTTAERTSPRPARGRGSSAPSCNNLNVQQPAYWCAPSASTFPPKGLPPWGRRGGAHQVYAGCIAPTVTGGGRPSPRNAGLLHPQVP